MQVDNHGLRGNLICPALKLLVENRCLRNNKILWKGRPATLPQNLCSHGKKENQRDPTLCPAALDDDESLLRMRKQKRPRNHADCPYLVQRMHDLCGAFTLSVFYSSFTLLRLPKTTMYEQCKELTCYFSHVILFASFHGISHLLPSHTRRSSSRGLFLQKGKKGSKKL